MTEWRTLTLRPIERSAFELWRQAHNLLCVQLGQQGNSHPSPTAIVGALAACVLLAPELQVPDEYRDDVLAGYARCWHPDRGPEFKIPHTGRVLQVCGSYAQLERHHRLNRSLGGSDSDLIWLCHTHHQRITNRVDGHGWEWLSDMLGYQREEADGHKNG